MQTDSVFLRVLQRSHKLFFFGKTEVELRILIHETTEQPYAVLGHIWELVSILIKWWNRFIYRLLYEINYTETYW